MLKVTVNRIRYQRNGVSGTGFFYMDGILDDEHAAIITMEYTDEEGWIIPSCRVVTPFDFERGWRGDHIGELVARMFPDPIETVFGHLTGVK